MEGPDQPMVPRSEPETEQRVAEVMIEKIENKEFDGIKIGLPYAREYLQEHGLDIDEDGFIISSETGEYVTPYTFVDELVKEHVKGEDESIFDAFFRPVTHERVYGWDNERLHLSDLHSVIRTEDGESHPVRDDAFNISALYARLETGFNVVMGWSDLIKNEGIDENGNWLHISKESEESTVLNCQNPNCGFSARISEWDDNEDDHICCPECHGPWDDKNITVCTICGHWYWGTNYSGESIYAEPTCANCGCDMSHLERISRYDDVESLEAVAQNKSPDYSVFGVSKDNEVVYTFAHTDSWDEAVDEKDLAKDTISLGSAFEEVDCVEIRERESIKELKSL